LLARWTVPASALLGTDRKERRDLLFNILAVALGACRSAFSVFSQAEEFGERLFAILADKTVSRHF
jgi:hypothetical protein